MTFFPEMAKKLFAHRGKTGLIAFFILYLFSHPKKELLPIALYLIAIGLIIRILARGYIGKDSATLEFKMKEIITTGIYKLRHPLYIGNFFLTLGVLTNLNPPPTLYWLTLTLFIIQYSLFIITEERLLREAKSRLGEADQRREWSFRKALSEVRTILTLFIIFILLSLKQWKGF